jgi:hypothetical protein
VLIVSKAVAAAVAEAEYSKVSVKRGKALNKNTANTVAAAKTGVVSATAATSILDAAESKAKQVALLAAEEAAEASANSVAVAAATQAVAIAAASASKTVEMVSSAANAAKIATEAAAVAAAMAAQKDSSSPSRSLNHRFRLQRLASFIIHRAHRQRVMIRRESRATRIILIIVGVFAQFCTYS